MAKTAKPNGRTRERPDPIDRAVGATVRQLRLARGLSQNRLARHLGVSFQQVQKYEHGANRMGASVLYRTAGFLDVAVADLFRAAHVSDSEAAPRDETPARAVTVLLAEPLRDDGFPEEEIVIVMTEFQKITDGSLRATVLQLIKRLAVEPRSSA